MITFKQFIAEIDHNDRVYSKEASHKVAQVKIDDQYKELFSFEGYTALWAPYGGHFKVVLRDDKTNESALVLLLGTKKVRVQGGELDGVVTSSISSKIEQRGKGLALKLYKSLVEHGQVLFSSDTQTSGSRKLWEQLVNSGAGEVYVLASENSAIWYIDRANKEDPDLEQKYMHNILLTGSKETMDDEAYADSHTRWVIVPHALSSKSLKAGALKLKDNK